MHNYRTQSFTVGFIFDRALGHVLLVHKQRPAWQHGKLNGVGGKYEGTETAAECIARETKEETSLTILPTDWLYVGTIHQGEGTAGVLATCYTDALTDAVAADHENIEWFPVVALPHNVIPNLRWLIPLCKEKLETASIPNTKSSAASTTRHLRSFEVYY